VSEVIEQTAACWPQVLVSDVSELIRGVTYSKKHATDRPQEGYIPVLRATNIQESRLVLESDLVFVPNSNVSANQRLRAGDIVVATSSGSKHLVGKSGLLHSDWPGSFGAFCAAIRPKANIESRYLAAFLQSPSYWKQVGKKALGVNINNLRRGDIESLTLPLPPLEKQREIVAELEKQFSRLDEAVANLQRVKANLKRYKASVLKAAVEGRLVETEATLARREGRTYETGEQLLQRILEERRATWNGKGKYKEPLSHAPQELPDALEGWTWCSLDVVAEETQLGLDRGREQQRAEPVGVRYVKMNNVSMDGDVQTDELVYVDASQEEVARYELANGDLLFNTRNSLELVGKVGIVRSVPIGTVFNNNLMRIRTCSGVSSVFLGYQMCAPDFRQRMEKVKKATTSVAAVYQKDLLPLPIALPPIREQARIVAEVDRHLSILREVEAEVDANLQRAQTLRQATLAKAFTSYSSVF